ncbi:hypothetical protein yc1106_02068 [Curvularia clavata]|uniref:Ankyrin repeat protein n=1 Tax=Curvularia clavata TaxID=95742 RepID=A0A9Q8Z4P2_CURCL|nr:hypothetical protein yc1106_02068 [Curvularia clavata]
MPPRNNCKSSASKPRRKNAKSPDYIWVQLTEEARAKQGKRTEFYFHGQICSDKKIKKNIAKNALTDLTYARARGMPATPKGWRARSPEPHKEESNGEELDSMELTTNLVQRFGVRDLTNDKEVLYGFLNTNGRVLSENLSKNLDEFIRYIRWVRCPADVLRAALFLACKAGSDRIVTILLSCGVSPNSRDDDGIPCLMVASLYNSESIVKILLEAGADVDLTDRSGRTSWDLIHGSSKHESIASMLWQKGLEYHDPKILEAAAARYANKIQLAIENDVDPSNTPKLGRFGPTFVARSGQMSGVPRILGTGQTPLSDATLEAAVVIIEAGAADIIKTARSATTPLDVARGPMPIQKPLPGRLAMPDIKEVPITNGMKNMRIDRRGQCVLNERDLNGEDRSKGRDSASQPIPVKKDNREGRNSATQPVPIKQGSRQVADVSPSPMSWLYTALGAPEVLKESPYKLSRMLGVSTHSAAMSIDGSSYRPSAPGQASDSLRAILGKSNQGSHKSWATTPPMRTPR